MQHSRQDPAADTAYEPYRHVDDGEFLVPPVTVKDLRTSKLSRLPLILKLMSSAVALTVIGVQAAMLIMYREYKDKRMLWQHGLGLKAWPSGDLNSAMIPIVLGIAGFTVLVNLGSVLLGAYKTRGFHSPSKGTISFDVLLHLLAAGGWIAAVVLDAVWQPSLRGWSCLNRKYAASVENNNNGLETVCAESISTLVTAGLVIVLEIAIITATIRERRRNARGKWQVRAANVEMKRYGKLKDAGDGGTPMLDENTE